MAAAAFLEKYFECVDSLPLDLQRYVTRLREVELEKRETQRLKDELVTAVECGNKKQMVLFRQLQECLLQVREVGNTKLEISAGMLDTVEEYTQQLGICSKELEMNPHSDDLFFVMRGAGSGSVGSHYNVHPAAESPISNGYLESTTKAAIKRSSSSKRPRQSGSVASGEKEDETTATVISNGGGGGGGVGGGKDIGGSKGKEGVPMGTGSGGGGGGSGGSGSGGVGNGKPLKKKVKTVKKRITVTKEKEALPTATTPTHMPMPDLTSQPLDPNEPTYCLCQQVSFGEMIGCDNDDCQIEWFHFQCVGLTSKPKGKWYCPTCMQERRSKSTK